MTSAEDVKFLLDLVGDSLNFGSGFYDTEEVDRLREIADVIGLDPWDYTPDSQGRNYPHKHKPFSENWKVRCGLCECWQESEYMSHREIANCSHDNPSL